MKKTNLYDMYAFGQAMTPLTSINGDTKIRALVFNLWDAREQLLTMAREQSPLLSSARRAVQKLIAAIDEVIPRDIQQAVAIDQEQPFGWYSGPRIRDGLKDLESVLRNEMPDIASYIVSQKGIYRTEDLIAHAENQLSEDARNLLPPKARDDVREAGKCLAYELSTACAFHLWRSVETVMGLYFQRLTGGTFADASVSRNWGAYVAAMKDYGAPPKITEFLDHIRSEYRNPQTHPDETVSIAEAQRLFSVAISSIEQLLLETKSLPAEPASRQTAPTKRQRPSRNQRTETQAADAIAK